ncbi:hypothetical protein EV714DRAFT_250939 [Schizophyllum commune]
MDSPSYYEQNYTPVRSNSAHSSIRSRASDGSARTPGDVPNAVRYLLLATKDLQEVLAQWSVGAATDTQVSDAYVRVGTDFNLAVHAFAYHNIDLSDIHHVPNELRTALEQCLADEPSPDTLARHMPNVRTVIYRLLQGLQRRQGAWEQQRRQGSRLAPGAA